MNKIDIVRARRNQVLKETDYTQIADAPISQDDKKLYREYRQYLRDIPSLWKNQQIIELKVLNLEEWKKNKPIYKVERKI